MADDKDDIDGFDEDDDDGFDPEEYYEDLDHDEIEEIKRENRAYLKLPIYKKAEEIRKLTSIIVETVDKDKDQLDMANQMFLNACMLGAKIAGAEGGGLYTLRMENAVIIKVHARELLTQTTYCRLEGLSDTDYLQVLRNEIEEFRKLFLEWVQSFDKTDNIEDGWGLFY